MSFLCVTRSPCDFLAKAQSIPLVRSTRSLSRTDLVWSKRRQTVDLVRDHKYTQLVRITVAGPGCDSQQRRYLSYATRAHLEMTNKPKIIKPSMGLNNSDYRSLHQSSEELNGKAKNTNKNGVQIPQRNQASSIPYALASNPNFRTMANVQKLVIEPTREHIENIRKSIRNTNAKDNADQQVTLEKDHDLGIAYLCIKSAAKNGISAKMMCDFLDTIDELYAWPEGKGLLIYGHNGFFCSGKLMRKRLWLA